MEPTPPAILPANAQLAPLTNRCLIDTFGKLRTRVVVQKFCDVARILYTVLQPSTSDLVAGLIRAL